MGMLRKFSMRCTIGVLLGDRFLVRCLAGKCGAIEKSVYDSADVKQVPNGPDFGVRVRLIP